ncbi:hypothetical protein B0H15DRAFT_1026817, partial [Mycena belliarum]
WQHIHHDLRQIQSGAVPECPRNVSSRIGRSCQLGIRRPPAPPPFASPSARCSAAHNTASRPSQPSTCPHRPLLVVVATLLCPTQPPSPPTRRDFSSLSVDSATRSSSRCQTRRASRRPPPPPKRSCFRAALARLGWKLLVGRAFVLRIGRASEAVALLSSVRAIVLATNFSSRSQVHLSAPRRALSTSRSPQLSSSICSISRSSNLSTRYGRTIRCSTRRDPHSPSPRLAASEYLNRGGGSGVGDIDAPGRRRWTWIA